MSHLGEWTEVSTELCGAVVLKWPVRNTKEETARKSLPQKGFDTALKLGFGMGNHLLVQNIRFLSLEMQNHSILHLFSVLKIHQFNCPLSGEAFFHISSLLYVSEPQRMEICYCELFISSRRFFCSKVRTKGRKGENLFQKHNLRPHRNRSPDSAGIPGFMEKKFLFWLLAELLITVLVRWN